MQRAQSTAFQLTGGAQTAPESYAFMFYVDNPSCANAADKYYISHISVGVDCASDKAFCVTNTPNAGGSHLYIYDSTLSSQHWSWMRPNYVDTRTLQCRFTFDNGDVVAVAAVYSLDPTTQSGQVKCAVPSHAAGEATVSLSLDGGAQWMEAEPSPSNPAALTFIDCGRGSHASSIAEACSVCSPGSFSNVSNATECTICTAGA